MKTLLSLLSLVAVGAVLAEPPRHPVYEPDGKDPQGRAGAISGRVARKAAGISPSGFVRTRFFAEKELPISQDSILPHV